MYQSFMNTAWSVLPLSVLGAVSGTLLSYFFPPFRFTRVNYFNWSPVFGFLLGFGLGALSGTSRQAAPYSIAISSAGAYFLSRLPSFGSFLRGMIASEEETIKFTPERMPLRNEWSSRPRYDIDQTGQFVGREEFVERLSSHFTAKRGGTILISGVRGVGKTALVDRALVVARRELTDSYWQQATAYLGHARWWQLIDREVLRVLRRYAPLMPGVPWSSYVTPENESMMLHAGAITYAEKPQRRFWQWLDPVDMRIRRLHEASRSQMFVLKFNASDISGALASGTEAVSADKPNKLRIDPDKLLRSVIRKLFMTCVADRGQDEVKILKWSLRDKEERERFFATLSAAYQKSISKAYKEVIVNSVNDLIKRSRSAALQGVFNVERMALLLVCVAIGVASLWLGRADAWQSMRYLGGGLAAAVALYFTGTWAFKFSRERSTDLGRQAQSSYEFDYSLEQMQTDLEEVMRVFSPRREGVFDPYRCYSRSVIVFDELDKLENADEQLDDVITHFKNFFTLSNAVFVFLTDHEFYEYLARETVRAQVNRHYPPQHTFFTEKIYLRKPEFALFRKAFFKFAPDKWLDLRATSSPPDPSLIAYLFDQPDERLEIESLPLETLTQLYVKRGLYKPEQATAIEAEFLAKRGLSDPFALAQIWVSQVSSKADAGVLAATSKMFDDNDGWENREALSFLYFCRHRFAASDQKKIEREYKRLEEPPTRKYTTVDEVPFTLTDLANAICFQTRDHYFDLYNAIYDYVGSYHRGVPVLHLEESKFTRDPRLWARYQQMVEIAFDSAKENHPSREYFNALLLETLYRVFDNRSAGKVVKVGELLFSGNGAGEAAPKPQADPVVAKSSEPTAFTVRDEEKINLAVLQLLRLAHEHKVIEGKSEHFEPQITNAKPGVPGLADLLFAWKDNSYSIISGVDPEDHEQNLINFWDRNKMELEAVDGEFSLLFGTVPLSDDAARLRAAIGELRTKAEGLRLRTSKVSRPDALALQSNVGTTISRNNLLVTILIDRINAEEGTPPTDVTAKTQTPPGGTVASSVQTARRHFESRTGLRGSQVFVPRDSDFVIYFLTSRQVPSEPDNAVLDSYFAAAKEYLLYYIFPGDESDLKATEKLRLFPAPGVSQVLSAYREITSQARLQAVLARLKDTDFEDQELLIRAGAEIMGPITEADVRQSLRRPSVTQVLFELKRARELFANKGMEVWPSYGITITESSTVAQVVDQFAQALFHSVDDATLKVDVLIRALKKQGDFEKFTLPSWTRWFATLPPFAVEDSFLQEVLLSLLQARTSTLAKIDKPDQEKILAAFVPQAVQWIIKFAQSKNQDLIQVLETSEVVAEIERQRKLRLSVPLANESTQTSKQFTQRSKPKKTPK